MFLKEIFSIVQIVQIFSRKLVKDPVNSVIDWVDDKRYCGEADGGNH
jgi:hypothetical protein